MIREFLREDIGRGDLTSESIFPDHQMGSARLVARESFVVAGAAEWRPRCSRCRIRRLT